MDASKDHHDAPDHHHGRNAFVRLQQRDTGTDPVVAEPNVFLAPLMFGDDDDDDDTDDSPHYQNRRPLEHGYDSTSTNDDAALRSDAPSTNPRSPHLYETASSSDNSCHPNHQRTLPNLRSSHSAPTDEEDAYYNHRYYTNTSTSRNQVLQPANHMATFIDAVGVGTTPTNPIRLHTINSHDHENDIDDTHDIGGLDHTTNDDFRTRTAVTDGLVHHNPPGVASSTGTTYNNDNCSDKIDSPNVAFPIPTTTSKMSFTSPSTDDWNNDHAGGGGRLWRLAGEVAAGRISLPPPFGSDRNGAGPVRQIKESFLERMRSRADPDATFYSTSSPSPATNGIGGGGGTTTTTTTTSAGVTLNGRMFKMPLALSSSSISNAQQQPSPSSTDTDDALLYREDEAFLMNTGLAHKRVRVVQLMIIGLFGILLPWMGNVFVSSNCYFAAIHVVVGAYGNVYPLHYGLWNYSPVSSALNGYKYCYPYYHQSNSNDDAYSMNQYSSDPPITSRICNSLALLAGTYSLVILWWYLISGHVRRRLWKGAVYTAGMAGMFQLATPISFFFGRTCRNNHCSVGPGTVLSVITAIGWMVFGAELHYHCPIIDPRNESNIPPSTEFYDGKTPRQDTTTSTSSWLTRTGDYLLWHDVRRSRRHQSSSSSSPQHQPPVVDVSQLEMSDFTSASQQYFNRFCPNRTTSAHYNPPNLS